MDLCMSANLLTAEKIEFRAIHVDNISRIPNSLRVAQLDDPKTKKLKGEITAFGLTNIPTVVERKDEDGDSYYVIEDGDRRITAIRSLVKEGKYQESGEAAGFVTVRIDPRPLTDREIRIIQLKMNESIEATSNKQYIDLIWSVLFEDNKDIDSVCDEFHVTKEWLQKMLKTVRLPEAVRDMIDNKSMSVGNAIELAKVWHKLEASEQAEWIGKAQTLPIKEFAVVVAEEVSARKNSAVGAPVVFEVKAQLLTKDKIEALKFEVETEYKKDPTDIALKAQKELMDLLFQLDAESIEEKRKAFDEREKARKGKTDEAQKKKVAEAMKLLAGQGIKVEGYVPEPEPTAEEKTKPETKKPEATAKKPEAKKPATRNGK